MLLICPAIHRPAIYHHIHSDAVSLSSLRIDLQTYEETQDTGVGTCTLLRHFSSRIPGDFVLVPCDFIPPLSLPLSALLNKFRADALSDGSIATTCWYEAHKPEKGAALDEWGPLASSVPIMWDETSGTLLHIDTPDDQDHNSMELELRMSLLSSFVSCNYSLCFPNHIYMLVIHGQGCRPVFKTLTCMSVDDPCWTLCRKSDTSIPSERNSFLGCVKSNTSRSNGRNTVEVCQSAMSPPHPLTKL